MEGITLTDLGTSQINLVARLKPPLRTPKPPKFIIPQNEQLHPFLVHL